VNSADAPLPRTAARVLLVDADERVLLMHERRDVGSDLNHWITPGGGVEAGETLAQAAVREVYEECGLRVEIGEDAEAVYRDTAVFTLAGITYHQTNHYFFLRCASGLDVEPAAHTDVEALVVLGHQWWDLDELARTSADREPVAIVDLVRSHLESR
jgi:8-oxo-dGTP pyrophosphatase MutT (NUDIX family)